MVLVVVVALLLYRKEARDSREISDSVGRDKGRGDGGSANGEGAGLPER